MSTALPCLLCGHEGHDVSVGLVEIPEDEQRVVSVSIVLAETRSGPVQFDQRDVRERYAAMPRCRDAVACRERVRAIERPAQPEPAVVVATSRSRSDAASEDDLAWL